MLSALLNVPITQFDDRFFKENCCVDFKNFSLMSAKYVSSQHKLTDNKFAKLCRSVEPFAEQYNLTIRQLMQYFGTNIMRMYFGDNL